MSRAPLILGLAALAVGAYAAIHYLKDSYELIPINTQLQEPSESDQFAEWYSFTDPAGKFTVKLPLLPQQASQQVTDPETGERREYSMYVAQTNDEAIYMISLIAFESKENPSDDEKIMRSLIDGMVKANKGNKLTYIKTIAFLDHSAFNFQITGPQNLIRGRSFMDSNSLYVLTRITRNGPNGAEMNGTNGIKGEDAFNYFADSFTLINNNMKPLVPFPPQP